MSKQSSIEWLWHNLTDDLIGDLPNEKIHEIYSLVLQAKQMHKEEIEDAYAKGYEYAPLYEIEKQEKDNPVRVTPKQYYQETYGGDTK